MNFQEEITYINNYLQNIVKSESPFSEKLFNAMSYSLSAGGKRLRPLLTIYSYKLFRNDIERIIPIACAIEMIHTYSLIHDDLPAMDNDDFRRGKPSNHKAFGEDIAILAGDGLLTLAFEVICNAMQYFSLPLGILSLVSRCSGPYGMVGGQTADIRAGEFRVSRELIDFIQLHKTTDLIKASVLSGAIGGGADDKDLGYLEIYAKNIGLSFQIIDDILDEKSSIEKLGKSAGKDKKQDKLTSISFYGIEESERIADKLIREAVDIIENFKSRYPDCSEGADALIEIARFVNKREY